MAETDSVRRWILAAQGGDRGAFDEIVRRYRDRLANLVRLRIGVPLQARLEVEDVLQETFTRAIESVHRFEWRGENSPYRWLATVAEHVILEAVRGLERDPKLQLLPEVPGRGTSPSRFLRRHERFDRLQRSIDRLSPEHRQVIVLSRFERLKVAEIARRMDRSPDAVKQLLSRALKKLKEIFGETESLGLPDRSIDTGGTSDGGPGTR
jgi:RNA polymerase sigma-70 factor (ECF subfamily)